MSRKRLGEYLVSGNRITLDQLQRALDLQALQSAEMNVPIGNILVQLGELAEADVALALEQQARDLAPAASTDMPTGTAAHPAAQN